MENQEQETELKLSKKQIQSVINDHIQQEHGLNDLFAMMVNGLMLSERQTFLNDNDEPKNKGNGYRYDPMVPPMVLTCREYLIFVEKEFEDMLSVFEYRGPSEEDNSAFQVRIIILLRGYFLLL